MRALQNFPEKIGLPSDSFIPAWWCQGPHAQTIFARFFRPHRRVPLKRTRLETPDQDFLDLDFLSGREDRPLVILLHGLEGSSEAPYIRSLLGELAAKSWPAVAVNFRGTSGEPNRRKYAYHSGKTEDLEAVINHATGDLKRKVIHLVGYSIGGNLMLKWLGEKEGNVPLQVKKAVAVSVPYDLTQAVGVLDQGFNRQIYTRSLLCGLKAKTRLKEKMFPGLVDLEKLRRARTFRDFDRLVTAPLNGFASEDHYWSQSSSRFFLERIRIPALLIHAADDPFFPERFLPRKEILGSSFLELRLTSGGGHLGFVSGRVPWKQELWLEKAVLRFLDA